MPRTSSTLTSNQIGFRTKGQWSVYDLTRLSSSARGIYNALHACLIRARLEQDYLKRLSQFLREAGPVYDHNFSWIFSNLSGRWKKEIELWIKYADFSVPVPPPPMGSLPFRQPDIPNLSSIYQNLPHFAAQEEEFLVARISMASPGGFSFTGLAEIVHQFRELIKDLWYRNKQEKSAGELQLIQKHLEVFRQLTHTDVESPPQSRDIEPHLVSAVQEGTAGLKKLEDEGKIHDVLKNLDFTPKRE